MTEKFRPGTVVKPYERLNAEQLTWLDKASLAILEDPGIWCYSEQAAILFKKHGARVSEENGAGAPCWRVSFQPGVIREAVATAPSRLVLGARRPENRLFLDAQIPRVYFGSGSESNIWLDTEMEDFVSKADQTGFGKLMGRLEENGVIDIRERLRYRHRFCQDGTPLFYHAVVGRKQRDITAEMLYDMAA